MPIRNSRRKEQISVPAEVRRRLGIGPGATIEWCAEDGKIVVRRAGRFTSEEIHRMLFPKGPPRAQTIEAMRVGVRRYLKERHARD